MLFNSVGFAIFFAIVLVLYWAVSKWSIALYVALAGIAAYCFFTPVGKVLLYEALLFASLFPLIPFILFLLPAVAAFLYLIYRSAHNAALRRNLVLLGANWYFYHNLHYTFPYYLLGMILVGYTFAMLIQRTEKQAVRKGLLIIGIIILGFGLTYIKYSGLILGNIFGLQQWQATALHILVPLGISYYTFSSIGYITDVYRRRLPAERSFITYASYISFFPHLLSGPIPSSVSVLPQFSKITVPRWAQIEQSVGEIIWGLFKKMVMAAHTEKVVNYCYARYDDLDGSSLFLGVMLFNLYLYADFSAYSDIARGVGRLMGIELTQNFKMPFFSRNPGEFWRRWHTSLRKWMLDYLYLPLGGNRGGKLQYIAAILFIFSFSGLWHGANMTFVCWGLLNGIYFIPYILTDSMTRYKDVAAAGKLLPSAKVALQIAFTFLLTTLSRIFFRAPDMTTVKGLITKIFSASIIKLPLKMVWTKVVIFVPLLAFEWVQREKLYVLQLSQKNVYIRLAGYIAVIVLIVLLHKKQNASEYYYFKF